MRTYSISEAADLTTLSQRALRARVDRGQIRAVLRDGVRRIPHSELERAAVLKEGSPEASEIIRELTERIAAQERELVELRALPERTDEQRRQAEEEARARAAAQERAEAEAAARREAEALAQAEAEARKKAEHEREAEREARTQAEAQGQARDERLRRLATAGWRERRRLLRELRAEAA